ncbi:MAG: filamentous hemagglutinin family protein [Pseudomonadota bacterium]
MNARLFRLVFNTQLGMYVPVHEAARSRGKGSKAAPALTPAFTLATLLAATPVFAQLPVACGGGACGSSPNPTAFVTSGAASYSVQGTQGIIQQTTNKAILNWQSFNIGAGHTVQFNQPNAQSAALNRIWQASPSEIAGALKANGHIYLLNQNGILFKDGAQVDVGALTASSLNISDDTFNTGILADLNRPPVFTGSTGFVQVEAGARLTAASGGRIMLLAPQVENAGVIETPDGQTILAAGEKVYLNDATDPAGVLVEVDAGGTATNLGRIIAQRGNVSLVGLAVNQQGRITATTSVRSGGSIFLRARDTVLTNLTDTQDVDGDGDTAERMLTPTRTGTVTLAAGSVTEVLPETGDTEEVLDAQAFTASRIDIQGRSVVLDGTLLAPGGTVEVSAVLDPRALDKDGKYQLTPNGHYRDASAHIYLGSQALIDVSGLENVALAMEDHQLAVKLYSEQLKDAPLLRGGPLFGQTVYLDAREGTPLFDYSAAAALNGKTVAEKSTVGGQILLKSEGDVVARQGSVLDVSGGSLAYAAGTIKTSQLTYQGRLTDISEARTDVAYEGLSDVYAVTDPKWGVTRSWNLGQGPKGTYHAAYTQGMDAGGLTVWAPGGLALDGTLRAHTIVGERQRQDRPQGGSFTVGVSQPVAPYQYLAPALLRVVEAQTALPANFGMGDALPAQSANQIAADRLVDFDHISLAADQNLRVEAAMPIAPEGEVNLVSAQVDVRQDISTPGGQISVKGGDINLAPGITLSTAGQWTLDDPANPAGFLAPVTLDGGSVVVEATGTVVLGAGSRVDVSAGAWRQADGSLALGDGGSIDLTGATLDLAGSLTGYGFEKGGSLSITVQQDVQIGGTNPGNGTFWLGADFFQQGGFTQYEVTAPRLNGGHFILGDGSGTVIQARAAQYLLPGDIHSQASADSLRGLAQTGFLPDHLAQPVDLTFAAAAGSEIGSLTVTANTQVITTPGGSITLKAGDRLDVFGSLIAPGGDITLRLSGDTSTYDDSRGIWIGDQARLLARSHFLATPADGTGLLRGTLLDSGHIDIQAAKGYLVLDQGAVLDASGTRAQVDVLTDQGYARTTLAGNGGEISLTAREGLLLDGTLLASGDGPGAEGGRLNLALLGQDPGTQNDNAVPIGGRVLTLTQQATPSTGGLTPGDNLAGALGNGQGRISVAQIEQGGFSSLSLASYFTTRATQTGQDRVVVEAGVDLAGLARLTFNTPLVALAGHGDAELEAAYLSFRNDAALTPQVTAAHLAVTAGNSLGFSSDWTDLAGYLAFSGVQSLNLAADLDIRARESGHLLTAGNLDLTARQIYPATDMDFAFQAPTPGATLTVARARQANGSLFPTSNVLSAGGSLTLVAETLIQGGALKAPLGEIRLEADTLTLAADSLTSVGTGGALIPYGLSQLGGREWLSVSAPPSGKITLQGDNVTQAGSAVLDLSGGGDLMAYEFVNGIYGSRNLLDEVAGVFAVLPGEQSGYAPADFNLDLVTKYAISGHGPQAGDAVYLSGGNGLSAGVYTLLPGRYALLPGAYLVQTRDGTTDMSPRQNLTLPDGSSLVSGYRLNLASGARDSRSSGFVLTPGSVFDVGAGAVYRGPAEYARIYANSHFQDLARSQGTAPPNLPRDAGQLVLDASRQLVLDGSLLTQPGTGGKGALVDIVSSHIRVVSDLGVSDGTLQLDADMLSGLNLDSLLLGGTRSVAGGITRITAGADIVSIENDAAHALQARELLLIGGDSLDVAANAALLAQGGQAKEGDTLQLTGDSAFMRLSSLGDAAILRSGASANPTRGDLRVGSNALLAADRALAMDATDDFENAGRFALGQGASAYFGARRISLGNPAGTVNGLLLDNTNLAALGQVARLTLSSGNTVDLYGGVDFGNADLALTLQGAGLAGYDNNGTTSTLTASTLVLANPNGQAFSAAGPLGDGTLKLEAGRIELGSAVAGAVASQDVKIQGYDTVKLVTPGDIAAAADGSLHITAASTEFQSGRLTSASGVDQTLQATGSLNLTRHAQPSSLSALPADSLGGRLAFLGQDVTVAGRIDLPAGEILIKAVDGGSGSGHVTLTSTAELKAASGQSVFDGQTRTTTAGTVQVVSEDGDVVFQAGAQVDVSGIANDGGLLAVEAGGSAVFEAGLAGGLEGNAGAGALGARFSLDAGNVKAAANQTGNDFSAVNDVVEAGGFHDERSLRLRNGDVEIAQTDTVTAERFSLTTEAGRIDVKGSLDARGSDGGQVDLHASGDVTLHGSGRIDASATAPEGGGGTVYLATRNGTIDLQTSDPGKGIFLAGGSSGQGGTLHLRAPRNAGNDDLAVSRLASHVDQARRVRLEGYESLTDNNLSAADVGTNGTAYKHARDFMANLAAIRTRLGVSPADATFELTPGVEITSAGDLTLASDWSLHAWRYDRNTGAVAASNTMAAGQNANGDLLAGILTLRAGGDLILNGSLSDGFSTATTAGTAQGRDAWSLRLVSGADLTSANPMGLQSAAALASAADKGDTTLANAKMVRTGAGEIDLAVAGKLTLNNEASVIYTAGRQADALAGFTSPTNNLKPLYLTDGGDIDIQVRGDIEGKLPAAGGAQQLVTNWLFRQGGGSTGKDVTWWVRPDLFKQGVATLGGGNVRIQAGGSIKYLSASAATTGRVPNKDASQLEVDGGGDLLVRAGGDLLSGVYHLGRGTGRLYAGGRIDDAGMVDAIATNDRGDTLGNTPMGMMLSLQDGQFKLQAGADLFVEALINPTLWGQSTGSTGNLANILDNTGLRSFFGTYGADSGISLASLHGDTLYGSTDAKTVVEKVKSGVNINLAASSNSGALNALYIQPGQFEAVAHGGNVSLTSLTLWPARDGGVNLLANGDVAFRYATASGLYVSDADASLLAGTGAPVAALAGGAFLDQLAMLRDGHALTPVHTGTSGINHIVARQGDITTLNQSTSAANADALFTLRTAQALRLVAGRDISKLDMDIQHVNPQDLSTVSAGRDLTLPTGGALNVGGPGEVLILAGRHIDLGDSDGINSVANTRNSVLDGETGANLSLMAGLGSQGLALADYLATYIDPLGTGPAALAGDSGALTAYRADMAAQVGAYMRRLTGNGSLSDAQALTDFLALDSGRQTVFVGRHLSSELEAAADAYFASGNEADYARGYAAIETLFPGADGNASPYLGDVNLFRSSIKTVRNASIDLLAPGGMVNAGLPGAGSGGGIVTERGGAIRSVSDAGFLVNQSKVITQYASDISVWVSNGDIDAGRGSQTAVSVPQKTVVVDEDGFVTVEYKGVATGSGIRAQTYDPDGPVGPLTAPPLTGVSVALLAPRGVLNAGEAGIAAGQLKVIAQEVLGKENIKVEGSASGVTLDASSIAAPPAPNLSDAGKVSDEATRSLADNSRNAESQQDRMKESLAAFRPTFLTVEVLGFGSGTASTREEEEARRQAAQGKRG